VKKLNFCLVNLDKIISKKFNVLEKKEFKTLAKQAQTSEQKFVEVKQKAWR